MHRHSFMRKVVVLLLMAVVLASCQSTKTENLDLREPSVTAPGEFEPQEYIWLGWNEAGFLGGPSFTPTTLELMRTLTPHVKLRLMYSNWPGVIERARGMMPMTPQQAESRLRARLQVEGVDMSRVELFHSDTPVGAVQDPGPFFLRRVDGGLAVADYAFNHPDPAMEAMDRNIAARLGLPTIRSSVVSEGGGRQSNGRGTLLLVESLELDRNPKLTREQIEREHLRVHGARKVIWLKKGPKEEESGKLEDGRWGIGTGGHVDEFARFADAQTILLAYVPEAERDTSPILRETHHRMEVNFEILKHATDQDGRPFTILRVPLPDLMTAQVNYDDLSKAERSWFEGAMPGERVEFYLPGSYLNFVIANGVVVTSKFWREGRPDSLRQKDQLAAEILQRAFPARKIVQIDTTPMLYDAAGLHCYTRNQPYGRAPG